MPPLADREKPGLSETLPFPRRLDSCQACGQTADPTDGIALTKWRECDVWDKPTRVLLVLCRRCSRSLINPHPRLYIHVDWNEPVPGAMAFCSGCRFAESLACTNPNLKANGGPGLAIVAPQPTSAFLCGRGRGNSGAYTIYHGPATSCGGRQTIFLVEDPRG